MASKPEDRYEKLEVITLASGRTVYKSARPKNVEVTDDDIRIVADEKDRMDVLAQSAFGSAVDWWRIAAANHRVNGSLHTVPNLEVIIPRRRG